MKNKLGNIVLRFAAIGALAILGGPSLVAGPTEAFYQLEEEMADAHESYLAASAHQAHGHRGSGAHSKSAKAIEDKRVDILQQMDALVLQTLGKPAGAAIALGSFTWSWNLDLDLAELPARFARIVEHYADVPDLEDVLPMMSAIGTTVATPDRWVDSLGRLAKRTKRKDTRIGAWFAIGDIQRLTHRLSEAKATFRKVLSAGPDDFLTMLAKGNIFEIEHLQVGMVAPDFSTRTVDGRPLSLRDFRGKVVLVDFWATWCAICVSEIPHLRAAVTKLKGKPFEVLAVSLDYTKPPLMQMLKTNDVPGIHTWDEAGIDNPVGILYNANSLPTWYLVDAKGVIRARDPSTKDLPKLVEQILAGKP